MIKKIIRKLLFPNSYNSDSFIKYLKRKGVSIGDKTYFYSPNRVYIDTQRPHSLHIGNYVNITSGVTILCHDYSRSVLCNMKGLGNVGEYKNTFIGDNVFIGINSIILMGTYIGNNSIVGAGSVVSGTFPPNSVICGNPAKRICSIEEYYEKRKLREIEAAKQYVLSWKKRYSRNPTIYEMTNAFSWLYIKRDLKEIEKYKKLFVLNGVDEDIYIETFMKSKPVYNSFDDFLTDCEK